MDHEKRGKCIILSHSIFTSDLLNERTCADKELENVSSTFSELGFQVEEHVNSKYTAIKKLFNKGTCYIKRHNYCKF